MKMTPASITAGQYGVGDTTYIKVFVGGLAWETQKDTMKNYFNSLVKSWRLLSSLTRQLEDLKAMCFIKILGLN
ncbi:hypothetical protein OROHE_018658 [Orobanche hederae]